jgi:hypothetical protein
MVGVQAVGLAVKGPRVQAAGSGPCTERSRPQDKALSTLQLTFWPSRKSEREVAVRNVINSDPERAPSIGEPMLFAIWFFAKRRKRPIN